MVVREAVDESRQSARVAVVEAAMQAVLGAKVVAGPAAVVSEVVAREAAARAAEAVPEAHLLAASAGKATVAAWRVAAAEAAEGRVVEAAPEGRLQAASVGRAMPEREEPVDSHQVVRVGAAGRAVVAEDGEEAVEVVERTQPPDRVAAAAEAGTRVSVVSEAAIVAAEVTMRSGRRGRHSRLGTRRHH